MENDTVLNDESTSSTVFLVLKVAAGIALLGVGAKKALEVVKARRQDKSATTES